MPNPESIDPWKSEPSPDDTVRLPAGEPPNPYSTQRLDIAKYLEANSTVRLSVKPSPQSDPTQKLRLPVMEDSPIRVQKIDLPADAAGQTQKLPLRQEAPKPLAWKLPLLLGGLVVLGVAAFLVLSRGPVRQSPVLHAFAAADSAPATIQTYLEQAKAGDAHAMRMLGAMYYYGLSVPRDPEKGLYWYRKAAEKGSDAARSELSKIEGRS
jgi:hypothetical protein